MPLIDYGSVIFAGTSIGVDNSLEKIQRIFTRRLYNRLFGSSVVRFYSDRLSSFALESLKSRYIKIELMTVFRLKHELLQYGSWHLNSSQRHPNRLILPTINTSRYRSCFLIRSILHWNKYVADIKPFKSISEFKDFFEFIEC